MMSSIMLPATWSIALPFLGMLLCAAFLPIGILVTRNNVKARRQEIIKDLESFFRHDGIPGASIIPSFEFVKTKYYVKDAVGDRTSEIPVRWYSIPIGIFVGLSSICFTIATVLTVGSDGPTSIHKLIPKSIFFLGGIPAAEVTDEYFNSALTIAMFAFFGAYISAIRLLIRSVANFDLSPLTFFRASYGIVMATMVAVILWRAIPSALGTSTSAFTPALFAAFVIGLVPGLAERYLLSKWHQGKIKQMDDRAIEQTKTIPLELIEGIDAETRSRLEDFNLLDVQNLATANPIMLFVETPYGIYQSIDWVAQAQLATTVGVSRFLRLRQISLRTIFDLERAFAADSDCYSTALAARIAEVLLPAAEVPTPAADRIEEARALVRMIVDDLAVLRLRQIWITVERNLMATEPSQPAAEPGSAAGARLVG